jgi:hypothetical protein
VKVNKLFKRPCFHHGWRSWIGLFDKDCIWYRQILQKLKVEKEKCILRQFPESAHKPLKYSLAKF